MARMKIAILGATGLIGRELIRLLEDHTICAGDPALLASTISEGELIPFKNDEIQIKTVQGFDFSSVELVFCALPKEAAKTAIESAVKAGCKVIDLSGTTRQTNALPIIPELNASALKKVSSEGGAIYSPEPAAIQLTLVLKALESSVHVKDIQTTVLYGTGRGGVKAMDELYNQSIGLVGGAGAEEMTGNLFPTQIAFNCIPMVGADEDGINTSVESAVRKDVQAFAGVEPLVTAITIPSFVGCSQSVVLKTDKHLLPQDVRNLLESGSGICVIDDIGKGEVSTPFGSAETDPIYVSRIRTGKDSIQLWISSDTLRKGSALNALQIAEALAA
jgi:aspartate-semialdehyde dehydrogenase